MQSRNLSHGRVPLPPYLRAAKKNSFRRNIVVFILVTGGREWSLSPSACFAPCRWTVQPLFPCGPPFLFARSGGWLHFSRAFSSVSFSAQGFFGGTRHRVVAYVLSRECVQCSRFFQYVFSPDKQQQQQQQEQAATILQRDPTSHDSRVNAM